METKEKLELIKRNTEEILTEEDLKKLLKEKKKPVIYWGCAPTGKIHAGYFLPMMKIADFLKAGFKVKILLADLHAALDNVKWSSLDKRYDYYKTIIPLMLKSIGVNTRDLKFVKGSDYQLKPEYMFDVLRLSSIISVRDSKKAASEVVKQEDNPKLSGLIYPTMQAIDEQYLGVDIQFGGTDQRKIMVLARENLPKIGYEKRVEIMNPLIPGLIGKKMSASDEKSKVDLMDSEKEVLGKINKAEMVAGNPDNGIMAYLKYVIFTMKKDNNEKFLIERPEKYGRNLEYENYETLEKDFIEKKLHPLDIKKSVAKEINKMLEIFRKEKNKKKLDELVKKAYE